MLGNLDQELFRNRTRGNDNLEVALLVQNASKASSLNDSSAKSNSSIMNQDVRISGSVLDPVNTSSSNDTKNLSVPLESSSTKDASSTTYVIKTNVNANDISNSTYNNNANASSAHISPANSTVVSGTSVDLDDATVQDVQDLSESPEVPKKPPAGEKLNTTTLQDLPNTANTSEASDSKTTVSLPDSSAKSDEPILLSVVSSHALLNSSLPSRPDIPNSSDTESVPHVQTSAKPAARKPKMLINHEPIVVGDFNVAPSTDLAEESESPSSYFGPDDARADESEFHSADFEVEGALIDADPNPSSGKKMSSSHVTSDLVGSHQDKDELKIDSETGYFADEEFQDAQKRKHMKKPITTVAKASREMVITVRKCCDTHEFFSSISHECVPTDASHFLEYAASLSSETVGLSGSEVLVNISTGELQACPGTGDPPEQSVTSPYTYGLLLRGTLFHVESGLTYNRENYCLEVITQDASVYDPSSLVVFFCPKITVRKCCREDEYFDFNVNLCQIRPPDMVNVTALLTELASEDLNLEAVSLRTAQLACQGENTPETLRNSFLNARGELCAFNHSFCYSTEEYCAEHVLTPDGSLATMTVVCAKESFHKCCSLDQMLSKEECIPLGGHRSALLTQLVQTKDVHEAWLPSPPGSCSVAYLDGHDQVRWWVNDRGHLILKNESDHLDLGYYYCVDDFYYPEGNIRPSAIVCAEHVDSIMPFPETVGKDGILGKCCPRGKALSEYTYDCVPDHSDFDPLEDAHLLDKNISHLIFSSFPTCGPENAGYHLYFFPPATRDHVQMLDDLSLRVVSTDESSEGIYVERTNEVGTLEYCVDTVWNETGGHPARAAVIVCSVEWSKRNPHNEKFVILPLLLGISCLFLLATAVVLSCMRVRRGLVTVKKVNTLAGRILLSYVVSYLLGSLALISSMIYSFEENYASCSVIAGAILFFMLAGFHWNTSICFESLLLTIHVGTSENWRFGLHSLLGWGLPGVITIVALTLDAHRNELPRHIVTLNIGRLNCLAGDHLALVLYMYIPISITLAANLAFLVGAKLVRSHKLKRLERGGGQRRGEAAAGARNLQGQNGAIEMQQKTGQQRPAQKQHSGLRTHQSRNLTAESVKLALWSGMTWIIDILGWIITRYVYTPNQRWYDYLWYIPSAINSLRGIGIFIILVLTPENRIKLMRMFSSLRKSSKHNARNSEVHSSSGVHGQYPHQYSTANSGVLNRNPSTSTTLTHLSTFRSNASGPTSGLPPMSMSGRNQGNGNGIANGSTAPRHPFAHSVSQIDMRRDSTTTISMRLASQSSEVIDDVFEEPSTTPSGGDNEEAQCPRVRSGLDLGKRLKSLQSVDEEDVFEMPSSDKASFTGSTETIDTTTC